MDHTQVGIIGAGPAGLMLGELLAAQGIKTVVIENRTREYCEGRIRAGVLEQGTVELIDSIGAAERLHAEGLVHGGIYLQFNGDRHHIDMKALTGGKTITVYGQQEVVKDLISFRLAAGRPLIFEAEAYSIENIVGDAPGKALIHYRHGGTQHVLSCDFIAGCDGFHGVSRSTIPAGVLEVQEREYPFGWLGVLADVAPSTDELIYSFHDRGFAMHSLRSPSISRLYLQVDPQECIDNWSDERIWSELQIRLGSEGWKLNEGRILDKAVTPMRSFVAQPMRFGKLFLAGDSAHIVPPTGAKGLNLAISDVKILAEVMTRALLDGNLANLESYSDRCLARVWRAQEFSNMMTTMLHLDPREDAFGLSLQRTRQRFTVTSAAGAAALAENYVGIPFDSDIMHPRV